MARFPGGWVDTVPPGERGRRKVPGTGEGSGGRPENRGIAQFGVKGQWGIPWTELKFVVFTGNEKQLSAMENKGKGLGCGINAQSSRS